MGPIGLPGRRGAGRPTMRIAAILVGALLWLAPRIADAEPGEMACGQEPGSRFFWIERAFCDLPPNGPERAHGVVIWNHGISGTTQAWMAPAPPVFRLLQFRGWDVSMVKRHHLAREGGTARARLPEGRRGVRLRHTRPERSGDPYPTGPPIPPARRNQRPYWAWGRRHRAVRVALRALPGGLSSRAKPAGRALHLSAGRR